MKNVYVIIFLFVLNSCNNEIKEETNNLNKLLSCYNTKIPKEPHLYVLQGNFGCSGCEQQIMIGIDQQICKKNKNNITLIFNKMDIIPKSLFDKVIIYKENNNQINNYLPDIVNIAIIKTEDYKIFYIKSININEIDSIINKDLTSFLQ